MAQNDDDHINLLNSKIKQWEEKLAEHSPGSMKHEVSKVLVFYIFNNY